MKILELLVEAEEAKSKRPRRTKKEMEKAKRAKAKDGVDARREKRLKRYATEASKDEKSFRSLAGKAKSGTHQAPKERNTPIVKKAADVAAPLDITSEKTVDNGVYAAMDDAYDMLTYFDSDIMSPHTSMVGKAGSIDTIKFVCNIETDDPEDVKKEINTYDRYVKKVQELFAGYEDDVSFKYTPFPKTITGDNLQSKLEINVK